MPRTPPRGLLSSLTDARAEGALSLDRPGDRTPETWFVGPKGENAAMLERLVARALRHNIDSRRAYMPGDPRIFPEGRDFPEAEAFLSDRLDEVLRWLRGSIPLSSHRNVSHMYWDQSLPAVVGYIAALLYNQNNVAAEASPATTLLEIEVGEDLCRMLGFPAPGPDAPASATRPWGHITCDGSVANIESVWAARNARYAGAAFAAALREDRALAPARDVEVRGPDGRSARLADLDDWALVNLPLAEVLALAARIGAIGGIGAAAVEAALARYSVQALGIAEIHRRYLPGLPPPVLLAPQTAHYSWPKAMALLGLGEQSLRRVPVDLEGRMEPGALREMLGRCLAERQPVMQVTAVLGSTEESAVDPLAAILKIREELRGEGLEFSVHADAAWGGYFASLLRAPGADPAPSARHEGWRGLLFGEAEPGVLFNAHVARQFAALGGADTITVDPHKAGFVPYPAGALCYRDGATRDLISFKAPVVYHGGVDPTVGVYGVEGSKPGAAAAAVYLSHRVIRPDRSGYGDLLARCLFNSKRFYAAVATLEDPEIAVTPFQRCPAERREDATVEETEAERRALARIAGLSDAALVAALRAEPDFLRFFREIGPDLTITTYACNFATAAGRNTDAALMNEMNDAIYQALSLQAFDGGVVPTTPMFITSSTFDPATYGQPFVDAFCRRAGVTPSPGLPIGFLISTVQNPWLTESDGSDMLATLMETLRATARTAARAVIARHGLTAPGARGNAETEGMR